MFYVRKISDGGLFAVHYTTCGMVRKPSNYDGPFPNHLLPILKDGEWRAVSKGAKRRLAFCDNCVKGVGTSAVMDNIDWRDENIPRRF